MASADTVHRHLARRLKAHLLVSTEWHRWHVPAARLILLKDALFLNIIIIIIITSHQLLIISKITHREHGLQQENSNNTSNSNYSRKLTNK